MNFSTLRSILYPAKWGAPRYRFGQRVRYLGVVYTVTGLRYTVGVPGDDTTPALMEWRYELDGVVFVPGEALEPVAALAVAA